MPAAPGHARSEPPFHIPSLDGIRAAAVTLVFLSHAGVRAVPGGFGVTVFFFLSGYLITTLLRLEADKTNKINIRNFYLRRAIRILPPFYMSLAFAVSLHLSGILPFPITGEALLFQVLHVTNYWTIFHSLDSMARGTNVLWSLAVEEHFYLIFPLFYVAIRSLMTATWQTVTLVAVCGTSLLWRIVLISHLGSPADTANGFWNTYATDTRADSILWGCVFAIACNPVIDGAFATGLRLAFAFSLGLITIVFTLAVRDDFFRETWRYTLQGIALIPVFTACIVWNRYPPFRLLNWRPIQRLGVMSYSFYLLHYTILYAVWSICDRYFEFGDTVASRAAQGTAGFLLSLAAAIAFHRWIESPCARLRKQWSILKDGDEIQSPSGNGDGEKRSISRPEPIRSRAA